MRPIKQIIIHHSESPGGDAAMIREWHKAKGWRDIGYHYLVTNGKPHGNYSAGEDGEVQPGRPLEMVGAHARGSNRDSIGICLIGEFDKHRPTMAQLLSLAGLTARLCKEYGLVSFVAIKGHKDVCPTDCPGHYLYQLLPLIQMIAGVGVDLAD